jgi:hypothetical protein
MTNYWLSASDRLAALSTGSVSAHSGQLWADDGDVVTPHPAVHIESSARSHLTLSTLATVLQSWDGHPHHRLTMPLQHGLLSLRWLFSTMAVLPGPPALRG